MDKDILEEATRLAERFESVQNRAQFARDFGVSGGGSMIYQHIKGLKPISMDAAMAYAKGFRCSLEDISPRLAKEAQKAAALLPTETMQTAKQQPRIYAAISPIARRVSELDEEKQNIITGLLNLLDHTGGTSLEPLHLTENERSIIEDLISLPLELRNNIFDRLHEEVTEHYLNQKTIREQSDLAAKTRNRAS